MTLDLLLPSTCTHGDWVPLDLLPATWLGIGVSIGVPLGVMLAVTVWRYSRGWVARWMDLREDPE